MSSSSRALNQRGRHAVSVTPNAGAVMGEKRCRICKALTVLWTEVLISRNCTTLSNELSTSKRSAFWASDQRDLAFTQNNTMPQVFLVQTSSAFSSYLQLIMMEVSLSVNGADCRGVAKCLVDAAPKHVRLFKISSTLATFNINRVNVTASK